MGKDTYIITFMLKQKQNPDIFMELRNTRKGERSIGEFLTRIKTIVDSLLAIGQTVSVQEQIDVILEGLPSEYESLVTAISSKIDQFENKGLKS